MLSEDQRILDYYLTHNEVVITLDSADLELLKKLLYDFVHTKKDFVATSVLLAYCTKTLTTKHSFYKDLAKISAKALEMILGFEPNDNQ